MGGEVGQIDIFEITLSNYQGEKTYDRISFREV